MPSKSNNYGHRKQNTEAEKVLWEALRLKKLDGFKFRNQHPIGKYVVDFYCHSERLVVELDGEYHENQEQKEYDMGRSDDIGFSGIRILRFKNPEILYNLEKVLETIRFYLKNKEQQPPTQHHNHPCLLKGNQKGYTLGQPNRFPQ